MIARRLARLEDSYAERARRERSYAEYVAERAQEAVERADPTYRQLERLLDKDPWARPMLERALHLCEGGCIPADRPEAERLACLLNEKLRALHAASGDDGEATRLCVGGAS